nr:hypothetical protein [Streptomyces antibioticus]
MFLAEWDLLSVRGLKPEHVINDTTLFDLVKLSFGPAGAGDLVALVVAYRRQRVDETARCGSPSTPGAWAAAVLTSAPPHGRQAVAGTGVPEAGPAERRRCCMQRTTPCNLTAV